MPPKDFSTAALVIVGHGSTENPDSSTPYFDHADEIRKRGIFAEVHLCFWKEEPSMREIYYMVESEEVFVVPDFISEGYFTQEVIPRELELEGKTTNIHGKTVHYCAPVGIHHSMTARLIERAESVSENSKPEETTLFIVGHGTGLNTNSTKAIKDQVQLIKDGPYAYAEVLDTYMEEPPLITDWHTLAKTEYVVVVPFFISDGLHSYQDIPVMLGIEKDEGKAASQRDVFRNNPYQLHGKTLYYSSAIGTDRQMADLIIDQVNDFLKQSEQASTVA